MQVWRVDGEGKTLLKGPDESKLYSGDCYIFQYTYPGETGEEYLVGTWFGKQSIQEDKSSATSHTSKMIETMKFLPTQARIYEGNETIQFFSIFQSLIIFKGGVSDGYKKYIAENELPDNTHSEEGVALFRVQGTGAENMQAIQVEAVASSLNSSHCYILHDGSSVYTWLGNLTSSEDQELAERLLDLIKPDVQSRVLKEGSESEQFWDLLGGKKEFPSQKVGRHAESDLHLFVCTFSTDLKVTEIYNFNQDDLMTEDIFILDCHSDIFVWVGQEVSSKYRKDALSIGEGSEPTFFTRFFKWDSNKSSMHGNSFQRKLAILKNGGASILDKPKRRTAVGRSAASPVKQQRSRSVSSSTPDRPRVRGRSPAFTAIASTFEKQNTRNLSTPPQAEKLPCQKSGTSDSTKHISKSSAIAALTSSFEKPAGATLMPRSVKGNRGAPNQESDTNASEDSVNSGTALTEDVKEGEDDDDEGLPTYPYERLTILSMDPIREIDVTKREAYLSSEEFNNKVGMTKSAFYELPQWKQKKLKMGLQLF